MVRGLGIAVALFFAAGNVAGADAPQLLQDPYQIYARTRQAWAQQRYPSYVGYTIVVYVSERGVEKAKHYHAVYDSAGDKVHVSAVSDEEHLRPPNPTGVTIHLLPKRQNRAIIDKRVGNPGEAVDYLGIPQLSPTYSFGLGNPTGSASTKDDLVARIRNEFNDPMPVKKSQDLENDGQLKSIASVTAIAHAYTIRFAGIENVAGSDCYHLVMQPARDPQRFRLRELWIDTQTFRTRQLLTASNFTNSRVPWLVTFADVDGAEYIASEVAQEPVGVGDHRYEKAGIAFEGITPAPRPANLLDTFMTSENVMTEPQF